MLDILLQILPLFSIILLGAIFGFFNKAFNTSTVSELNKYAYYIGFPCIILNSFISIENIPIEEVQVALINTGFLIIFVFMMIILSRFIFKEKQIQNTYIICAFFGNVAYLGFPLISSINEKYVSSLSLHIASYLVVLFTIGIVQLEVSKNQGQVNFKKLLKTILFNPLLLSTFIGITITALAIPVASIFSTTIEMISASASPVVLFALGIFIAKNKIIKTALQHALAITSVKLLALPLLLWLISFYIPGEFDLTVSIIIAAMPAAITPFVLAEIYEMDKKIIASTIIISTVLSILSISLIISLF